MCFEWGVEDRRKCLFQYILDSSALRLALPTVEFGAIIGADTFPTHGGRVACETESVKVEVWRQIEQLRRIFTALRLGMWRQGVSLGVVYDLDVWQVVMIAGGAACVGLGKGGLPGVGNLTVVLLALALPAKASVGVLLPILIAADIVAVVVYRRHALWPYILKLAPWTVLGIVIGWVIFSRVDDDAVRTLIGVILLSMCGVHFFRKWLRRHEEGEDALPHHPLFVAITGIVGGFATMIANAAGPVAALYFIASGLPKYAYIGTAAWFFFLVNIFKIPFMMELGIIDFESFELSARFMPYAVLAAIIAPFIVRHINQKVFEFLIWFFVIVGGLKLVF